MLQALLIKTAIEAARRAFWKNGAKGVSAVADIVNVKHQTADPEINDELARVLAILYRGVAFLILMKLAQLVGFDITPYLHLIFQTAAEEAAQTITG